ncbi:lipid II:glycine glycyltransferase FemX [Bifidobacterium aesculapii]|uniref:lipid II:glycine glycyltransferase FemX n=1 Tax=Bifidobacterium aesculapii TaxID=1329411 RepID=UPI0006E2204B|nr:GNAT family N-acetyltransferase [Bifidobacterium aesculapii]
MSTIIEETDSATMEREAARMGVTLPIEQTRVWADYQAGIDGRAPWGCVLARRDGRVVALLSLIDYHTHGYHYLRSTHGPVWASKPGEDEERELLEALAAYVHAKDHDVVFLRLDTWYETGTFPVLSTVPYNETVVVDLTGGDEEILARMRKRGRRDVRKALRESPAVCADETDAAAEDFSAYYDVMVETAERDGFEPAPQSDYEDMIRDLGPDHCRVFAARVEGEVVAWAILTVNGDEAVYYYACVRTEFRRALVPDKLLYTFCCALGERGVGRIDLMGVGNDFSPSIRSLNTFKTKFAEETTPVAPSRDVPVRRTMYQALQAAKRMRDGIRGE